MVTDPSDPATARPATTGTSPAAKLVAVVITALVFGGLSYVANIAPKFFSLTLFDPAPAVGPAFGIWFGFWGGLGGVLGSIVAALPAGQNPLPVLPAFLVQGLFMWLPALLYRRDRVRTGRDWLRLIGVSALTCAIVVLVLVINLSVIGTGPFLVAMTTVFPVVFLVDLPWMVLFGALILNIGSPYMNRAGLRFPTFI